MTPLLVAVFGDVHAHAEALEAVLGAAERAGAGQLWSLGDMVGGGPDPEHAVRRTRERCAVALLGNHDYGATGSAEPLRFGAPGSLAVRSIELARERLGEDDVRGCGRAGRPRGGATCTAGTGARATRSTSTSARPTRRRASRASAGRSGWSRTRTSPRPGGRARATAPGRDRAGRAARRLRGRKWLLNPGAVGAPVPSRAGWWDALDAQAADGASWLLLDLDRRTATWHRAPYDPAPARARARALGLDDDGGRSAARGSPR